MNSLARVVKAKRQVELHQKSRRKAKKTTKEEVQAELKDACAELRQQQRIEIKHPDRDLAAVHMAFKGHGEVTVYAHAQSRLATCRDKTWNEWKLKDKGIQLLRAGEEEEEEEEEDEGGDDEDC